MTGYQLKSSVREGTMKRDGDTWLKELAQLALKMSVVVGFIEQVTSEEH
ncbi:hypothetical protein L1D16_05425 [Vibrio sp. Isolate31]|nr:MULTISPECIES: hypothetical protein [unclassified Vibrio]MCG9553204.1 hypothetical protein [Vibrio sp. Isolate32]MCG9600373.1 hypothetical protein [Vibrio sp. Isolate31]